MKNCNSRYLIILLGAVGRKCWIKIFAGVPGQAGNMQVKPVLETQPAVERDIGIVGRLLFIKTNSNREKETGLHKRQYVQGINKKKVLRTHAVGYGKKETKIINITRYGKIYKMYKVHVTT